MGLLRALKPPPTTTAAASEGAQGRSQPLPCASSSSADSYNPYRNSHKMRMMTDYTKGKK